MARRAKPLSPDQMDPRNSLDPYARAVVQNAEAWTDREIRQEYSRLRDIARKREIRLGQAGLSTGQLGYAPARGQSTEALRAQISGLAALVASGQTVRAARAPQPKAPKAPKAPAPRRERPPEKPEPPARRPTPETMPEAYIPQATRSGGRWSDKEIRQEYTRLRDIMEKRLKRLGEKSPESKAYQQNVGRFRPARGQSTEALRKQLPDLAKLVRAKGSSVSGQKAIQQQTLGTLHEHGYDFVNEENLQDFGDWMEEWRQSDGEHVYGSPEVAEEFEWAEDHEVRLGQIKDKFFGWMEHREEMHDYVDQRESESAGREHVSAEEILSKFAEILHIGEE